MNLSELEQLAKAVAETGSYAGWDEAANPETILRLIEVMRQMATGLEWANAWIDDYQPKPVAAGLAAYREFCK